MYIAMKKIIQLITILSFILLVPFSGYAQCKGFAKKICKMELGSYIHDGNYHAAVLTEGEEAELYKTCSSGQEYRLTVCSSEVFPSIEFKVLDANNRVLFFNRDHNYTRVWDFKPQASQQLKVWVRVPVSSKSSSGDVVSGCVAIMFGFKNK